MVSAQTLHWIFSVPVGLAISTIGLIGNIISILVWRRINNSKLRLNQSTGIYFIALAVCDTGLLLCFVFKNSLPALFPSLIEESYAYAIFYCYLGSPFLSVFLITSTWLTVGVTMNRFLMIILPIKVGSLCTPFRTYCSIFGFVAFSLLINIPQFFIFVTIRVNNRKTMIVTTSFGSSKSYELWLHCIFALLTPWLCIAILNAVIVYNLSVQRKDIEKMSHDMENGAKLSKKSKQQQREDQVTRTLLVVTISFLVLLAWQCVSKCLWISEIGRNETHNEMREKIDKAFAFCKLSIVVNSSMNCLLYCFTGSMFRNELKRTFGCISVLRRGSTTNTTRNTQVKGKLELV